MARYPTYEEYARDGKFADGIKRCDDLLKKHPRDVSLLTTKLQLTCASQPESPEGPRLLDQLIATQPPVQDLNELVSIELAVADSFKNTYPPPKTLGPVVARLWENAYKANSNLSYRSDLLTVRYQRAIYDNRLQDAQQTLIQFKQFQPKDRAIYMAHAAYTQLLSNGKDDLQSKLALGLARKAVSEKFDDDKTLDCRVAGQIFALQNSETDLESIRERQAFRESKQVYDALQLHRSQPSITDGPQREFTDLEAQVERMKTRFKGLTTDDATAEETYRSFAADAIRLFHASTTTLKQRKRAASEPCFLAISSLVKLHSEPKDRTMYLLQAAFLAEQLLKFEPDIHEARVILVYLYMRLGLGGEAMRLFDSLSIKEVQFDTMGHTLFTRLSTVHPFRTELPNGDHYDPHDRTNRALQVPPRHEGKLFEAEAAVLDHKQTGMIFELNQLRDEIRHSFMRRVTLLEHRRMARLAGKGYGKGTSDVGPRVIAAWTNLKDNRDYNATYDFGYKVEKALQEDDSAGTVPGKSWLVFNLAIDQAHCLASSQIPLIANSLLPELDALVQTQHPGLTLPESRVAHIVYTLISTPTNLDVELLFKQIENLNIPDLCATDDVLSDNLHAYYVYIDILLIVVKACTTDRAKALRGTAFRHIRQLQECAMRMASMKKAVSVVVGERLRVERALEVFGEASLNDFAEKVAGSAKEGWEGVGKVVMLVQGS